MKTLLVGTVILLSTTVFAQNKSLAEKLFTDQKGFITCTGGGSSAPLFTANCAKLTLSRISAPGSIKYEGTCIDSNETTFYVACDAITFEYGAATTKVKEQGSE